MARPSQYLPEAQRKNIALINTVEPNDIDLYLIKAQTYNDAELWDQAVQIYNRILLTDKTERVVLQAHTGRGHSHLMRQDWKAAQQDFQNTL